MRKEATIDIYSVPATVFDDGAMRFKICPQEAHCLEGDHAPCKCYQFAKDDNGSHAWKVYIGPGSALNILSHLTLSSIQGSRRQNYPYLTDE